MNGCTYPLGARLGWATARGHELILAPAILHFTLDGFVQVYG